MKLENTKGINAIIKILPFAMGIIGISIWAYGWNAHDFNLLSIGMFFLFMQNVIFSFQNVKERILFLVFQLVLFTFLLARPFLGIVTGDQWWLTDSQAEENVRFTVMLLTLSLVALFAGAVLVSKLVKTPKVSHEFENHKKSVHLQSLQSVAFLVFIVTAVFFFIQAFEKVFFMKGREYIEYYSEFHEQLPGFVYLFASFMKYSLCIFLATLPSKRKAFISLFIFEMSAIPPLIIGIRNPLILNSLFIFLYYFIRDIQEGVKKKKWIGKIEKNIIIIFTPIIMIFMMLYAHLRSGSQVKISNPFTMIVKFFYDLGMSVGVISMGYGHSANITQHDWQNYTFGGIIDYIRYGRIGQMLFGTEALPAGNSLETAQQSNSLAHQLGYVVLRDDYLKGRGLGSSYLLENYLDFGYIGVVIFSIVLGALLIVAIKFFYKYTFLRVIILVSLTSIFFMPRAEATEWLTFIVTLQFWLCVAACWGGSWIVAKSSILQNILMKLKIYTKADAS